MIQYIDNIGNIGVVPTSSDLADIAKQIERKVASACFDTKLIPIPDSANDLLRFFTCFTQPVLLEKKTWKRQLAAWTNEHFVIILDDVLCHGDTIMDIINTECNLRNVKLIIILYHIVSENICLFDIEEKKYTLHAEGKFYFLYFIKERFLLRIPTLIYETRDFLMMKSDVIRDNKILSFLLDGEYISYQQVLPYL